MASDPKDGAQDQADVQDDQTNDVPESDSQPPGDEAHCALDKTNEDAEPKDEKDRDQ